METKKDKLAPAFNFVTEDSSILLHTKTAEVHVGDNIYTGSVEVRMDLTPRASVHLYGTFSNVPESIPTKIIFGQEKISSFQLSGHEIEGFYLNIGGSADNQEMTIKWSPCSEPIDFIIGNAPTKMNHVIFHLFNFKDAAGKRRSSKKRDSIEYSISHIDLSCNDWQVEICSTVDTQDQFKKLKSEGGYRLTHVGCLCKKDGANFSIKTANDILSMLRFFLSFAKGRWCEPICAVGFDELDSRVWESWASPRELWSNPSSWFSENRMFQLETLFPGFVNRWNNEDWRETLRETIYWYMNANNNPSIGIDAGIILTQTAIERLSYEYATKTKKLITIEGFKSLRASDKMRLLFSSIGIPIDALSKTPDLEKLAKKFKWIDAPHALTEVRNSLVHPEHKRRGQLKNSYYAGWHLGLWYLELSILRICGYSGKCFNRITGKFEQVPWE